MTSKLPLNKILLPGSKHGPTTVQNLPTVQHPW